MARVTAIFYRDGLPFSLFEGWEEQFELNKEAPGMSYRLMNDTPWERITRARFAPPLAEFDAWREANPPPSDGAIEHSQD